jgi:cell wall assembly regulator SMI1
MRGMSTTVRESWQEITAWLRANAPATHTAIRRPLPAARVAAAAETLGRALPEDLATWWTLHDGLVVPTPGSLFPGHFNPYGIESMLTIRSRWLEIDSRTPSEGDRQRGADLAAGDHAWSFLAAFVPIAGDGSGDELVVDLREGAARGCVKDYSHEEGALHSPVAPSLEAMLVDLLGSLRDQRPIAGWTPEPYAGYLTWNLSR